MEVFDLDSHEDLDNFRLLDAAETLVNLQSMQEQQQQQQHQDSVSQSQHLEPGGILYLSTTSPSGIVGSSHSGLQISPLSSPMLHHLSVSGQYEDSKSSIEQHRSQTPETAFDLTMHSVSPTSPGNIVSTSGRGSLLVPMTPTSNTSISAFLSSDKLPVTSSNRLPSVPENCIFTTNEGPIELMKPPPNPSGGRGSTSSGRRGRGRGRGASHGAGLTTTASSASSPRGGGRGRGRGRGRGSKSNPVFHSENNNDGVQHLNGSSHGSEQMELMDTSSAKQATQATIGQDTFQIGDHIVRESIFDEILNQKKLEFFLDPEVQSLLSGAKKQAKIEKYGRNGVRK